MNERIMGIVAGFDKKAVFGIGLHLPWSDESGRSAIKRDMGRVVEITRDTILAEGKQNVLVMGRGTIESMGWRSLPKRNTVIVSQTLDEKKVNATHSKGKDFAIARNTEQAVERALRFSDCGHIFFFGGETIWLEALKGGLCNAAFITVVNCDSVKMSRHKEGIVRRLPEMLLHETFTGMTCKSTPVKDLWGEDEVTLEFREYRKA